MQQQRQPQWVADVAAWKFVARVLRQKHCLIPQNVRFFIVRLRRLQVEYAKQADAFSATNYASVIPLIIA